MQPILETSEQFVSATKEKTLKDAATNTNGSVIIYGTSQNNLLPSPSSPFAPKDVKSSASMYSCPNFQDEYQFNPSCHLRQKPDLCDHDVSNNELHHMNSPGDSLYPSWCPGEMCYQRTLLRRSPVAYNIKILNNEVFGNSSKILNSDPNNYKPPSNLVYIPTHSSFNSEREFHNICYGGIRSNLDSRLSSSDGSLASSISRYENHPYVRPQSRVVDLLDLQTVVCDPVLQHQKSVESKHNEDGLYTRGCQVVGNGIQSTEIRYPKQDVFRIHHKQKATILSENNGSRNHRSGRVKKVQNSVWIKRNSNEWKKPHPIGNTDVYCMDGDIVESKIQHVESISIGNKTLDREQGNNYCQPNFDSLKNKETEAVKNNSNVNISYSSLPCKKRKYISDVETHYAMPSSNDLNTQNDILMLNSGAQYNQRGQSGKHFYTDDSIRKSEQSETNQYALPGKIKRVEENKTKVEARCNNIKPYPIGIEICQDATVPNQKPNVYNHSDNVQQSAHQQLPSIINLSLPKDNDQKEENVHQVDGQFLSPMSSAKIHTDNIIGSKESTPPYNDTSSSSIMKLPSPFSLDPTTGGMIQYSSSKSCLKYRRALAISSLAFSTIMIMTFCVLYWNYSEALHRRMTHVGDEPILDHWGKRAPTEQETRFMANISPVDYEQVPGGLDKGIGNKFMKNMKEKKKNSGFLKGVSYSNLENMFVENNF